VKVSLCGNAYGCLAIVQQLNIVTIHFNHYTIYTKLRIPKHINQHCLPKDNYLQSKHAERVDGKMAAVELTETSVAFICL
jgi:hypothetical protein